MASTLGNDSNSRITGRLKRELPFSRSERISELPLPSDAPRKAEEEASPAAQLRQQLERSASTLPMLPAPETSKQRLPRVPALIGLEPKSGGQVPKPAAAAHPKAKTAESIRLPKVQLNSAKLVEAAQIDKRKTAPSGAQPTLVASGRDIKTESLEALGKKNPLWADILGRETTKTDLADTPRVLRSARRAGTRNLPWAQERAAAIHATSKNAPAEGSWFVDSPLPFREFQSSRGKRLVRRVQHVMRSRRFSQAVAAVIVLFFVSSLDVPRSSWFSKQVAGAKNRMVATLNSMSHPIEERAAFFIAEDFQEGLDAWKPSATGSANLDSNGLLKVKGLVLHEKTLNFVNYRFDFDAKIQSGSLGWVVRAADNNNYYAYKLVESARKKSSSFRLERYSVINGLKVASTAASSIPLPNDLAKSGVFNNVSVRVRDNQITTMINGWGVDFWRDSQLDRGGIGFLAAAGDSALINKMTISGNNDSWGLLLYGTAETLRSIRDTISPPVAMMGGPEFAAPVAVLWQPFPRQRPRY
jgi:hypothetical protein